MFSKIMEYLHKINFYDLFEIQSNSKPIDIINAYKRKINKIKNIHILDNNQILEIKILKSGLHILLDKKLRLLYNKSLESEPLPMNHEMNDSFESVFNIDNSWMNNNKIDNNKKNDHETNMIGDRIFSLTNFNRKPGYSTNDEIDLRKPLQGRVEKKI